MTLRTADEDVVRLVEIAGRRSFMSPSPDEPAIAGEFHDARRSVMVRRMAVGHKDITIWRDSNAGRSVEGITTIPGHALLANYHQHIARRTQFDEFMAPDHTIH